MWVALTYCFFFFNDTATTEIYTLSLHDALPICLGVANADGDAGQRAAGAVGDGAAHGAGEDRKSTRLNSSHLVISYAVFCLKKKKHQIRASSRRAHDETGEHHSPSDPLTVLPHS